MAKAKKMGLRQRLRHDANKKLLEIGKTAYAGVERAMEEHDTKLNPMDVMRFIAGNQVRTLQQELITQLANEAEAELERIYNRQQGLPLEDKNDSA